MTIKHYVKTLDGKTVDPIEVVLEHKNVNRTLYLKHDGETIGYAQYTLSDGSLYVSYRRNTQPEKFKGIGITLGKYLFFESHRLGAEGRMFNSAYDNAHVFHYKWGMRVSDTDSSRNKWVIKQIENAVKKEQETQVRQDTLYLGSVEMNLPPDEIERKNQAWSEEIKEYLAFYNAEFDKTYGSAIYEKLQQETAKFLETINEYRSELTKQTSILWKVNLYIEFQDEVTQKIQQLLPSNNNEHPPLELADFIDFLKKKKNMFASDKSGKIGACFNDYIDKLENLNTYELRYTR